MSSATGNRWLAWHQIAPEHVWSSIARLRRQRGCRGAGLRCISDRHMRAVLSALSKLMPARRTYLSYLGLPIASLTLAIRAPLASAPSRRAFLRLVLLSITQRCMLDRDSTHPV